MIKKIVRRERFNDDHLPSNLSPIIKQIYASRGVERAQQLDLKVANLQGVSSDQSYSLKGLPQACDLLHQALKNKTNIIIVGDFDADGATSTALMMVALNLMGSQMELYQIYC